MKNTYSAEHLQAAAFEPFWKMLQNSQKKLEGWNSIAVALLQIYEMFQSMFFIVHLWMISSDF